MSQLPTEELQAIATGQHTAPFAVLGAHALDDGSTVLRTFQPKASHVAYVASQQPKVALTKVHPDGVFEAKINAAVSRYQLECSRDEYTWTLADPYSFSSMLGDTDRYLFGEGRHYELHKHLGSHVVVHNGVAGVQFAVWAPNAKRVSVVGEFNEWDGRMHVMRSHPGSGLWDIFIPGLVSGVLYKLEIVDAHGQCLPLKHDPYAPYFEQPPGNASMVYESKFVWSDDAHMASRADANALQQPISVYEVHAGSWQRNVNGDSLNYRELADTLIPYVLKSGFTHIELLPITEHPLTASWGYQPIGMFAPTSRFGSPDDFRYFVDGCHKAGIGVIMDWVPAHFPSDAHGLGQFDGTALYEHADPRQGIHKDWNTLIFNYGRNEVANYLISNALYWIQEFHLDGLRVDAVASMLYLDYSREDGEWIPNKDGGNHNLDAIEFLRRMNEAVHLAGGMTFAEESTSFPQVSHPTYAGGLGFTFKWNMGWMHDNLSYFQKDPAHRKYHQEHLTFGLLYAFTENFQLPFSHDEVVHGKGSLINKMPGDDWQKRANLRALLALMFTYPGKKLLFMGCEIGQYTEWSHDDSVHWDLLNNEGNAGVLQLVTDLNALYKENPALHSSDCDASGFEWIDCSDADQSVVAFQRLSSINDQRMVVVCNFTPVPRQGYRVGVPALGDGGEKWNEVINSDASVYAGSGLGHAGAVQATGIPCHGLPDSLVLTLPPLSVLVFQLA
jgi:1,4-alpha-glucan branching enzyme